MEQNRRLVVFQIYLLGLFLLLNMSSINIQPLTADGYYHIYNRAIGNEKLFLDDPDYLAFLSRIIKYLLPNMDFYAYCLMPNHFHFFIRLHDKEIDFSKCFADCFNSYTKWFNKRHDRKGGLFITPFKRKEITSNSYYTQIVYYIHRNPVHHRLSKELKYWRYSSYQAIISENETLLKRQEILEWFYGRERFIAYHQLVQDEYVLE